MTGTQAMALDQQSRAGTEALRRNDPATARRLFEGVVMARPADAGAWFGLALACRDLGDTANHLAALDRTLQVDARHLSALIMKADHYAKAGDGRAAEAFYRAVIARAPPAETLSTELGAVVRRAEEESARYARAFEDHLQAAVASAGFDPATSSRRFAQSLDLLLGKKQLFFQAPTSFYFPELPQRQFYERQEFPWLTELEAKTPAIRRELLALTADHRAFEPYIQTLGNRPPGEFGALRDSLDWSAYHLIKGGVVDEAAAARCPQTFKALRGAPLCESPGRTPSVLFSLLRPGARIPPHTGQTNAHLICHLPLIVPEGCGLRVGNETRAWVEGEALIFDDAIEHEAWNTSGQVRVVLLFEIWRPELTMEERELVAALLAAVGTYDAAGGA